MDRLVKVFDSFPEFTNGKFTITEINFEIKEDIGLAYAEGLLSYIAISENHEINTHGGQFKLYFTLEYEWWSIYYFVIPGFEFTNL
jgi:hypothetical protein